MGCVHGLPDFCLKLWRRLTRRRNGHGDIQTDTVTSSIKRDNSYRAYMSHEELVPELGVTTPDGCYYLLLNNKALSPMRSPMRSPMSEGFKMVRVLDLKLPGNLPSPIMFKIRVIIVDRIPWSCKFHEVANHPEEHAFL
ncbi:hypothetical protein NP493_864g02028 [Ridgeia piscesae]|uniref:Uncharacterized protein n=1 Tax=Ridgeia piscesae TaxID=27915 RepID=A0AAD9KLU3_RIDPI|nr:hypothetical protein NP493_864g02028 [Ridgeia piscesae]